MNNYQTIYSLLKRKEGGIDYLIQYFINFFKKTSSKIKKIFLLCFSVFCLSGCDGNDGWCLTTVPDSYISSDSITTVINTEVQVNANGVDSNVDSKSPGVAYGKWVTSNVTVLKGDTVSISATGNVVLAPPYGLDSQYNVDIYNTEAYSAEMSAYNSMVQGSFMTTSGVVTTSGQSYYANGGLGTEVVVMANESSLTQVKEIKPGGARSVFSFVAPQKVTITTKNCTTGDQNSSQPTKWTWNNGWKYGGVYCEDKGTSRSFTTECGVNDNPRQCKAVKRCSAGISYKYYAWKCTIDAKVGVNYNDTKYFSQYNTDVCPASSNGAGPTFDCASNSSDPASINKQCGTNYSNFYCPSGSDWCGGSHKAGGVTVSDTNPGSCGFDSGYVKGASINTCGSSDTCWNTNGFRFYAVQSNVTGSCRTFPVDSNCIHLYQSNQANGGLSFYAQGGPISLIIADPVPTTNVDVSALQNQLTSNQTQINSLQTQNDSYATQVYNSQLIINNAAALDCSQIKSYMETTSEYAQSLYPTDLSISNALGMSSSTGISGGLNNLYNYCIALSSQTLSDYPDVSSGQNTWNNTLTSISSTLSNLVSLVNNLSVNSSASSDPSSTELQAFKTTLNGYLASMQNNISNFDANSIPSLRKSAITYVNDVATSDSMKTILNNIITNLNSLQIALNDSVWDLTGTSFNIFISPLYEDANTGYPAWYNLANNTIRSYVTNLTNQANSLTDSSLSSYKATLTTMLSNLNNNLAGAIANYNSYYTNEQQINNLETTNNELSKQISQANSSSTGTTGGYTAYVRADPIIASDGENLQMILSQGDPNDPSDATYELSNSPCNVSTPGGCTVNAANSGTIWFKLNDPDEIYNNNFGYYKVTIGQTKVTNGFGNIFTKVINQIKMVSNKAAETMVNNLVCNNKEMGFTCWDFLRSVHILLVLYIVVFGFMFLSGLVKINYIDFVLRVVKIGLIITVTGPGNYNYLYTHLFQGFSNFATFIIASSTGLPAENPFAFLSQSISAMLLDSVTYFKIFSLIFQGIIGLVAFVMIISAVIDFAKAIFSAFQIFMISFVGLALCFALAPIFILFILFKPTFHLFEKWFAAMVRFTIEPMILFVGLIIINALVVTLAQQIFNFSACFKCVFPFTFYIPGVFEMGEFSLFCLPGFAPWGMDNLGSGTPFAMFLSIPVLISFKIACNVMKIYSDSLAKEISKMITGGGMSLPGGRGGEGRTMMDNPFQENMDFVRNITGTRKEDFVRRSQRNSDDLLNRALSSSNKPADPSPPSSAPRGFIGPKLQHEFQRVGQDIRQGRLRRVGAGGITLEERLRMDQEGVKRTFAPAIGAELKEKFDKMREKKLVDPDYYAKAGDIARQDSINRAKGKSSLGSGLAGAFDKMREKKLVDPDYYAKVGDIAKQDSINRAQERLVDNDLTRLMSKRRANLETKYEDGELLRVKGDQGRARSIINADKNMAKEKSSSLNDLNEARKNLKTTTPNEPFKPKKSAFTTEIKGAVAERDERIARGETRNRDLINKQKPITSEVKPLDKEQNQRVDIKPQEDKKVTGAELYKQSRDKLKKTSTEIDTKPKELSELEKVQAARNSSFDQVVQGEGIASRDKGMSNLYRADEVPKTFVPLDGVPSKPKEQLQSNQQGRPKEELKDNEKDKFIKREVVVSRDSDAERLESKRESLASDPIINKDKGVLSKENINEPSSRSIAEESRQQQEPRSEAYKETTQEKEKKADSLDKKPEEPEIKEKFRASDEVRDKMAELSSVRRAIENIDDKMKDFESLDKEQKESLRDNINLIQSLDPRYLQLMDQDNLARLKNDALILSETIVPHSIADEATKLTKEFEKGSIPGIIKDTIEGSEKTKEFVKEKEQEVLERRLEKNKERIEESLHPVDPLLEEQEGKDKKTSRRAKNNALDEQDQK